MPLLMSIEGKQQQHRCKLNSIGRMVRLLVAGSNKSGGSKMRLLLLCSLSVSFSLFLVFLATRTFSSVPPPLSLLPGKGYTVVINTWKRNDLLRRTVAHYSSCAGVDSIHVVWSEPDLPQNSLIDSLKRLVRSKSKGGREIEIKFDVNQEDSLNNRFKEMKDLRTDAIYSIDDDVITPCSSLEFAYTVWNSAPSSMVGFVPRMHWLRDPTENCMEEQYIYGGWWSVWWSGSYSMILSKAAFFHKQYLAIYTNQMLPSIRDYVTKNRNCEDIAMSFLVANVTGSPPIWVQGKIREIGSTGISSLGGHIAKRSKCVNDFAAIYGTMPLVPTSMKAVDSRSTWFW
ncbi:nucleotide-diphospho-sugar transferases superfamily protein [Carex rostrata]